MENYKIGNDAKCRVILTSDNLSDIVNIRSIKAIFINTTKEQQAKEQLLKKAPFLCRYPKEPCSKEYQSTEDLINGGGRSCYNVHPSNMYNGFGVNPDWDKHRCKDVPAQHYRQAGIVRATDRQDAIDVYLLAKDQHYLGDYKLIIIAKIYEEGYYDNDIKTVTIDCGTVFSLSADGDDLYTNDISANVDVFNADANPTSVVVDGQLVAKPNSVGVLNAKVFPRNLSNVNAYWSVVDNSRQFITIVSPAAGESSTHCQYRIVGEPDNTNTDYTVQIKATAAQNNSNVYDIATITVSRSDTEDIYVDAADYTDGTLTLSRNGISEPVVVNIGNTQEETWWEEE